MDNVEQNLADLGKKLDELIKRYHEVVNENNMMRKKLAALIREKAALKNFQEKIEGKIKNIVVGIKDEIK
jgi:hypothetical protein